MVFVVFLSVLFIPSSQCSGTSIDRNVVLWGWEGAGGLAVHVPGKFASELFQAWCSGHTHPEQSNFRGENGTCKDLRTSPWLPAALGPWRQVAMSDAESTPPQDQGLFPSPFCTLPLAHPEQSLGLCCPILQPLATCGYLAFKCH